MWRGPLDINFPKIKICLALLAGIFTFQAFAEMPSGAFWRRRQSILAITTSAQSITASLCSGAVTVETRNASNVATNVLSDLTVNLTGPATMTFYSDAYCSVPVTSVTVLTASSSRTFYFVDSATGNSTLNATATGYKAISQIETMASNGFVWTGGGGNANWATGANWSGGSAPNSGQIAVFNGVCSSNCSPNIAANIDILGIRISSTYSGTITQNTGSTITVESKGWVQTTGTFTGSSSTDAINMTGVMVLTGGTFTSTHGTLTQNGAPLWSITGTGTFAANTGTVSIGGGQTMVLVPGGATYNNVSFGLGIYPSINFNGNTMNVDGNLILDVSSGASLVNGTISVKGNITAQNTGSFSGSAIVKAAGNAGGQTISETGNGQIPNLTIDAGANPVTLSGAVKIPGDYNYISSGAFTATGSTLWFVNGCGAVGITPGTVAYNDVKFDGSCPTYNLNGGTMTVNGNLSLNSPVYGGSNINNGTFAVAGDVITYGSNSWSGTVSVKLTGNPSGQTVTSLLGSRIPNLTIATGTNPVTFATEVNVGGDYIVSSVGTLTTTGSTLYLNSNCAGYTITPGTATYNNVKFMTQCSTYSLGGSTMTIAGNLTFESPGYGSTISSGTFSVSGNVTAIGPTLWYGTSVVSLAGNASGQTVSTTTGGDIPNLTIAAGANAVTFGSSVRIKGNYIVSSVGALTTTGSTLQVGGPTLTVGTENYNNLQLGGNCANVTLTGTMNVLGNAVFDDSCSGSLNSGTLVLGGHLTTFTWNRGTTGFIFNGASAQTITQTAGSITSGAITVNGAGLTLATNVNFDNAGQTTNVIAGTINMAGHNLSLKTLTLNGNTVTRSAGSLVVNGSTVPGGTQSLYGGTINP